MNRREFGRVTALFTAAASAEPRLELPVLRVMDRNSRSGTAQINGFLSTIWNEAVQVFSKGGIRVGPAQRPGDVLQYPSGKPLFRCLDRTMINVVLTDRVPLDWDKGRSLGGVTALYEGYCVCVISTNEAHGNQVPFLAVNTVVHELLHVLLGDIFAPRTSMLYGQSEEARVDMYATALWLFGRGDTVRESARKCLKRLEENARGAPAAGSCAAILPPGPATSPL